MHEGHRSRLRNKIINNIEALTDHELLEFLLYYSIPRINTNEISHRLIDEFGSLQKVLTAKPEELMQLEGVGQKTAAFLSSLGRVYSGFEQKKVPVGEAFNFDKMKGGIVDSFSRYKEEVFIAYFLDNTQKIIAKKVICNHLPTMVKIDLSELSKQLVLTKAKNVVVCHNHLSGICEPSIADDRATEKISLLLSVNGATLVDHLIIAEDKVFSYYYSNRIDEIRKKVELSLI